MADELGFPDDTLVRFNYLPSIRAKIALNHGRPSKAIEELQPAIPYELGALTVPLYLGPVYLRGDAYLAAHQPVAAIGEFQKIIAHRGIVRNHLVGALAHLQLGKAYALAGDKAKAKSAYQDFLTLWRDADANIPLLIQAKAEYSKLQ